MHLKSNLSTAKYMLPSSAAALSAVDNSVIHISKAVWDVYKVAPF